MFFNDLKYFYIQNHLKIPNKTSILFLKINDILKTSNVKWCLKEQIYIKMSYFYLCNCIINVRDKNFLISK